MVLTIISIVGSYSRGAFIGLGALGLFMLLRVRNRFVYLAIAGVVVVFLVSFMPENYFHRMDTISTVTQDASVQGRLYAWRVAFLYASDHFPFGAGFSGPQLGLIFHHYFPDQPAHAAHSIYFQVLGDHGFIGLGIYLIILAAAFLSCSRIISVTRALPEQRWAHDLAIAISGEPVRVLRRRRGTQHGLLRSLYHRCRDASAAARDHLAGRKKKRPAWAPPPAAVPR